MLGLMLFSFASVLIPVLSPTASSARRAAAWRLCPSGPHSRGNAPSKTPDGGVIWSAFIIGLWRT
ncbi:hypothetical protein EJ06DRAFT_534134 [Trichodelitschia bisporula]|uniref:Secreted protein n=1 Tax=Trichodelitschia bisporula TaxID=703511 RepID=A0A6G1HKW8_9PEZI|nr:hypothetical protein EJ06DRAFT_534134 [Trichodelitschia bisporula]